MERILQQICIWKQLPGYQAERRIDIFFGVFLKRILTELGYFEADEEIVVIPEFPQPTVENKKGYMRSVKIDYIAVSESKLYAIELKTDTNSIRKEQYDYYLQFMKLTWDAHKEFVDTLKCKSRAKTKYTYLQNILKETKYPGTFTPTKVIYIAPDDTTPEHGFDLIRFKDIAQLPSDGDELFNLFKSTLKILK